MVHRRGRAAGAAVMLAAGLTLALATLTAPTAPAAAATEQYELTEIAPGTVYSVVGPLAEAGGVVYFEGTNPSAPTGSWLFSLDPGTGLVGPVAATASLAGVNGLVSAGGRLYFFAQSSTDLRLFVYDPATDAVGEYSWGAGDSALPDELAAVGTDLFLVMTGDGLLYSVPQSDAASAPGLQPAPTTPSPACLNGTDTPGLATSLTTAGGFVYYEASCADVGAGQLFRRSSPSAGEVVGFPAPPAASDLVAPAGVTSAGRTFFSAGLDSALRRIYSFDPGDLAQGVVDLGGDNPGTPTTFQGAATWFMDSGGSRRIFRSTDGSSAEAIGPASAADLDNELRLTAWGDILLLNGFRTIAPGVPVGTRANYLYDPGDGSLQRLGPDGAIVAPFVDSSGAAYVTAFAAGGADGDSQHLYRVVRRELPATGADALGAALTAGALIAAGAALVVAGRARRAARA